ETNLMSGKRLFQFGLRSISPFQMPSAQPDTKGTTIALTTSGGKVSSKVGCHFAFHSPSSKSAAMTWCSSNFFPWNHLVSIDAPLDRGMEEAARRPWRSRQVPHEEASNVVGGNYLLSQTNLDGLHQHRARD